MGKCINNLEICTRERFIESYSKHGEEAVKVLDEHKVFPLTYKNPALQYLNVLGLYVYYSGTIIEARTPKMNFRACLSGGRAQQRNLAEIIEQNLGLVIRNQQRGTQECQPFSKNGSTYARLLSLMGFHTCTNGHMRHNTKASTGSTLPPYLTYLIENFNDLAINKQRKYGKYLRDFLFVLFDTRASLNHERRISIDLPEQPTKELFERQAEQIIRTFNILYPKVGISHDNLSIRMNKKQRYDGCIYINADDAALFSKYYGEHSPNIKIQIKLEPNRYSFER